MPQIVEVTDISGLSASPDGRRVAFRTERASIDDNSYVLRWHVTDPERGSILAVAGGGQPIYADPGIVQVERAFWSPDGQHFLFRALLDGAVGIWNAAADGRGARPAVIEDADAEALRLSEDGQALLFELGPTRDEIRRAEEREYHSGILVDRHVDLAQNIFRGGSVNGRMASQRLIGPWFTRAGLLWDSPRRLRRLDLRTMQTVDVRPLAPSRAAASRSSSLTARALNGDSAVAAETDGIFRLEVHRSSGGQPLICTALACRAPRIDALAWRPGRDEIVFTVRDAHNSQSLHLWSVRDGTVRLIAAGEGLLSGGRDARAPCAITPESAVCVAASAASPPRLERIDLDSGGRSLLFDPNASLRAREWPATERMSWSSSDGQAFTGILLRPRSHAGRLPLLINYYRCEGFLRGGVGDELPFMPLVGANIAVLCINAAPFRGPHRAVSTYQTALEGVRSAIDRLAERGVVGPSRVGMGGLSFGSEVTMWVAMRSNLLAAASIASIQLEPAYYWFNAVRGRDHPDVIRDSWGLGPPDETQTEWRLVSPALNAGRIRVPLLLQLPEQEARYVVELYARLTTSATPAELYVFPDEAHIKIQPRHKLAVYRRNYDWFRFWLTGHVDPDPAAERQYRRWNELAERRRASRPAP